MFAFTPDRGRKPVETEVAVRAAFDAFDTYFMLEDEAGSALLATGNGFGPFALEWFPASRVGTHLKASEELKRSEVLDAMLAYLRGDPAWRESRPWLEVEDRRPGWIERLLMGGGPGSAKNESGGV
jgi:hypothetical protein